MDKALVFGTKDCRFESCQGHSRLAPSRRAAVALETRVRGLAAATARRGVSARDLSERLRARPRWFLDPLAFVRLFPHVAISQARQFPGAFFVSPLVLCA